MNVIIAALVGLVVGILACYAWLNGFYKKVGGK